jgi:hypothetical protein
MAHSAGNIKRDRRTPSFLNRPSTPSISPSFCPTLLNPLFFLLVCSHRHLLDPVCSLARRDLLRSPRGGVGAAGVFPNLFSIHSTNTLFTSSAPAAAILLIYKRHTYSTIQSER